MSETSIETEVVARATEITVKQIYSRLSEKVSDYNARLLINSACLDSSLINSEEKLNEDEVKSICLALINKGGPSFQVGREFYNKLH